MHWFSGLCISTNQMLNVARVCINPLKKYTQDLYITHSYHIEINIVRPVDCHFHKH